MIVALLILRFDSNKLRYRRKQKVTHISQVNNYDFSVVANMIDRLRRLKKAYGVAPHWGYRISHSNDTPNWKGVIALLKHLHDEKLRTTPRTNPTLDAQMQMPMLDLVLHTVMKISTEMVNEPWEKVEKVLEYQHVLLIKLDKRWE